MSACLEDARSYQSQTERDAYSKGYDHGKFGYGFQKNLYQRNSKEWNAYKDGYYDGNDNSTGYSAYDESLMIEDTSNSAGSISLRPGGFSPKDSDGFDVFWFKNPQQHESSFREWAENLGFDEKTIGRIWGLIATK